MLFVYICFGSYVCVDILPVLVIAVWEWWWYGGKTLDYWIFSINQKFLGPNLTHSKNLFLSCSRLLTRFRQSIQNEFCLSVVEIFPQYGLKIWIYVIWWLAVVSDWIGTWVENYTKCAKQTVHTWALHKLTHIHRSYHMWIQGLEYTMYITLMRSKPKGTVLPTCHSFILVLTLRLLSAGGPDINYLYQCTVTRRSG